MLTRDERIAAIKAAMDSRSAPHSERMWAKDEFRWLEVYEVPVEALVMNPDNRRFRVDRLWAEEQLGRSLDPDSSPKDALSVESLLLDTNLRVDDDRIVGKPTDDTVNLRRDFLRRGQERPFWIRPDGRVRNGNRRLAMIRREARDQGDTGLLTIEAVVLPEADFTEEDLFHMEAREQLTEGYKVRYSNINYLLHLRDAANLRKVDWNDPASISDVAGELQMEVEKSKREVERDLTAVKYMDEYLAELGSPGSYHQIPNTLEVFRAIGEGMSRVLKDFPDDAAQALQVFFAAVNSGESLHTVRSLRAMQRRDRTRFEELAEEIDTIEERWDEEHPAPPHLVTPETVRPNDEDEDDDETAEADAEQEPAADYPDQEVGDAIAVAVDAFATSSRDDLAVLLQEAHTRLRAIRDRADLADVVKSDAKAMAALRGIAELLAQFGSLLVEPDSK